MAMDRQIYEAVRAKAERGESLTEEDIRILDLWERAPVPAGEMWAKIQEHVESVGCQPEARGRRGEGEVLRTMSPFRGARIAAAVFVIVIGYYLLFIRLFGASEKAP